MAENKVKKKEKILPSDIVMYSIMALQICCVILLIVSTVLSFSKKSGNVFIQNIIPNYTYIIITFFVITFLDYLFKKKGWSANEWLKSTIYVAMFLLINVYNMFSLYVYLPLRIIAYVLLGAFYSIVSVSLYYNYLKNSASQVRAKAIMVCLFSLTFAIAVAFFLELLQLIMGLIFAIQLQTVKQVFLDILYSFAGALIINILFFISLKKEKKFINFWLIDVDKSKI